MIGNLNYWTIEIWLACDHLAHPTVIINIGWNLRFKKKLMNFGMCVLNLEPAGARYTVTDVTLNSLHQRDSLTMSGTCREGCTNDGQVVLMQFNVFRDFLYGDPMMGISCALFLNTGY